ncbi:MAG: mechanosensitive ion channel family protein [Clostridiales bacterium]|nr:mechanosensitive ion channel family protein [Clostridiales bacterium]
MEVFNLKDVLNFSLNLLGDINLGKINITNEQINKFISHILRVIIVTLCMYVAIKVGNKIIEKAVEKQKKSKFTLDPKKANTIGAILKSILKYVVYFLGFTTIFSIFFNNITLTFAGIGGVALGLGAQSLIKDVINGFFILFEEQYSVGDYITIEGKSGVVESIELRITKIRDFSGDLHIFPNGSITTVTNHSRGDMRFVVEVDIAYEEDAYKAMDVLREACNEFSKINDNVVSGPDVSGVSALKDSGVTIKIVGKAKAMKQWSCENELRAFVKKTLDEAGIEIAYPVTKVLNNTTGNNTTGKES